MGCQDVDGQRQVAARVALVRTASCSWQHGLRGWVGRVLSGVQTVLSKFLFFTAAAPINV